MKKSYESEFSSSMTPYQAKRNVINSQNIAWKDGLFIFFLLSMEFLNFNFWNEFILSDESKFGKVMLERMGWKAGSGLGKHEQGITKNLQVKANVSTRGIYFHNSFL